MYKMRFVLRSLQGFVVQRKFFKNIFTQKQASKKVFTFFRPVLKEIDTELKNNLKETDRNQIFFTEGFRFFHPFSGSP